MSTLAELWETVTPTQPSVKEAPTRIAPNVQAQRDQGALAILQNELKASQDRFASATDPQAKARHQADIAGLQREIGRMSKTAAPATSAPQATPSVTPAPAAPAADSTNFADIWQSMTAEPSKTAEKSVASTQESKVAPSQQPVSNVRQIVGKVLQKGLEAKQALPGFLASTADVIASAPSALAGVVGYGAGRLFGGTPEEASASSQKVASAIAQPVGRITGLAETPAYKESLPTVVMDYIGKNIGEGAESIAKKFGVNKLDVENAINAGLMTAGAVAPKAIGMAKKTAKEIEIVRPNQAPTPTPQSGMVSAGAAVVPDATTIKQALSVATPELQQALSSIPPEKVNIPTLQRHIEADSLPVPVRLTEGQATGDIVKLSREQNRRGQDPSLAQRFNEQNGQLVENLGMIR